MNEITVPTKNDPRDLDLGKIRLTATGIQFLAAPNRDEWLAAMEWIGRCQGAVAWWLGDMVLAGDSMFGEEASQGYEKETVRKFAWICEKVNPDVRRKALSFTHHEKVAKLEPREQRHWLELAERMGWSAKELARQIKGEADEDDDKELCPTCGKSWNGVYAT